MPSGPALASTKDKALSEHADASSLIERLSQRKQEGWQRREGAPGPMSPVHRKIDMRMGFTVRAILAIHLRW